MLVHVTELFHPSLHSSCADQTFIGVRRMALDDEMKHLRFEFLMNGTRKSKFIKPLEPPWYNTHMKPLLEAQFKVHEDRALDDVEHMISRGERKMTGTRERKKYEKKECGPVVLAPHPGVVRQEDGRVARDERS